MDTFPLDKEYAAYTAVTGIDEVGRGCLAGPVVVAAVTWKPGFCWQDPELRALDDSKAINAKIRAQLFQPILEKAARVRVAFVSNHIIDHINILQATLHGFELVAPDYDSEVPLFIDGNKRPVSLPWAQTVVKGERALSAIAAASVIAKVCRDGQMVRLHKSCPEYGFGTHMGYATKIHCQAIDRHGPGPFHRKCFQPIRDLRQQPKLEDQAIVSHILAGKSESDIWARFCEAYGCLSLPASRGLINRFQAQGWRILPSSRDDKPFPSLEVSSLQH